MNLLISESLPVDAGLDRAIPWVVDLEAYLDSVECDEAPSTPFGQTAADEQAAWYELRLSTLRQAILDHD